MLIATQAFSQQPAPSPPPAPAPATASGKPALPGSPGGAAGSAYSYGRKKIPQLPPPTREQLKALDELQREAQAYEQDAADYRKTITRIIRHHYEERRRRVISALDREISIEQKGLRVARLDAIKRLELFVKRYSGKNSHPMATPDAMFRLAALYEEQAREVINETTDLAALPDLSKAIALYKRIVHEFPKYREIAGVYYYLGHSLNDMGRLDEAQQVWRSLVCNNHYTYPVAPDPHDASKDTIVRLPQDHDADWWLGWMQRHPEPLDMARKKRRGGTKVSTPFDKKGADEEEAVYESMETTEDEDVFVDPFPDDCRPIEQKTLPGDEPRYLAEVWWLIGDFHFEEIDPFGGPFNLNRADSAYHQSMKFKKPPVHGVARYKLAWTYYKQQRYRTAVKQFVELLKYTDEQEKLTGNTGADFRAEAYAYIAGSVTYLDFEGPAAQDPYIARNDIFDLESDPAKIEEKMRIAIDRISDADLIPQNAKWTAEIYKALAFEFKEYNQYRNHVDLNEIILQKWPMHRDAPFVQNQIAETYEQLAGQSRKGTAEYDEFVRKALEARGKLVNYVATPHFIPPWVEANKEDPEAIHAAERLVRGGLRRAAADHTNAGRQLIAEAKNISDKEQRDKLLEKALAEYQAAAKAWGAYLVQDENAEDAYESRFWLADAYTAIVVIQVQMGGMPSDEDVARAVTTARQVRDSNEGEEYLQPAGLMVVSVAAQTVSAYYRLFKRTDGAQGFEQRTGLRIEGEGESKKYIKEEIPTPLRNLMAAWEEYNTRVPPEKDPFKNHDQFAYNAGEVAFIYGHFEEARKRLYPIYMTQCQKTKFGYLAWEKLITMANQENDTETSRALAETSKKKSCAIDEEQKVKQAGIADPTIIGGYYIDASKAYKQAEQMPEGPERDKAWRRAAAMYQEALRKAPERDEAPEAAILGAKAYKQVGDYDQAIAMYQLFIKEYGNNERLDKLKTDGKQEKYDERVKFLKLAYDELGKAYVLFFDYRAAAETYEAIAKSARFEQEARKDAGQNAVFLYANVGDRAKMLDVQQVFYSLGADEKQKATIDWLVASADLKAWDERGLDRGANQDARLKAIASLQSFYAANSGKTAANEQTVKAAYYIAKMMRAGSDSQHKDWCQKTIAAFEKFKGSAPTQDDHNTALGSLQADMAAECDYREVDEEIKRTFDYDNGHHRYQGVLTDVHDKFKDDVEKGAKGWFDRLQEIIVKYESRPWAVAARARQGSLYDSCRTGLYNAREPGLKLYTEKEEKLLKQLDKSCVETGSEKSCELYDTFTANRRMKWRESRDTLLADADRAMVAGYSEAIVWSRAWKVRVDAVDNAVDRLAFFTEILGDAKLREYTTALSDPATKQAFEYEDGMFPRMRRGMIVEEKEAQVLVSPLPEPVQP